MNKDNAKQFLPLVQALAEGKEIQVNDKAQWVTITTPTFTREPEHYRIKPDPVVLYANEYTWGWGTLHTTNIAAYAAAEQAARSVAEVKRRAVKFVEVIEK